MNKQLLGIIAGIVAGILDVIPMILQNLTWDANLSAFSLWVVSGFLISVADINTKGFIKGIIVSFLVLLPSTFIIGWHAPTTLIPIFIMTLILGSLIGFVIDKFSKQN